MPRALASVALVFSGSGPPSARKRRRCSGAVIHPAPNQRPGRGQPVRLGGRQSQPHLGELARSPLTDAPAAGTPARLAARLAAEQAQDAGSECPRNAAVGRMLDHYPANRRHGPPTC